MHKLIFLLSFFSVSANAIELSYEGLAQVEAFFHERDASTWKSAPTSDIGLASLEFQASAQFDKNLSATVKMVYERPRIEGPADSDFKEPEEAYLTWQNNWFDINAGKVALPFGRFETVFINETLLQGFVETFEGALVLGKDLESWGYSLYVFNGSVDVAKDKSQDNLNNFGSRVWGVFHFAGIDHKLTLDYISQGADSDGVQDTLTTSVAQKVPTVLVAYAASLSQWSFNFEYAQSLRKYGASELSHLGSGAMPKMGQVELSKEIGQEDVWFVGAQYQWTEEAKTLSLPKQRVGFLIGKEIAKNQTLKLELHRDNDYTVSDSGTGHRSFGALAQFEITF